MTDNAPVPQRVLPAVRVVEVVDDAGAVEEVVVLVEDVVVAAVVATVVPEVVGAVGRREPWLQPSVSAARTRAAGPKCLTAPAWHGRHAKMCYALR
ncbi:MAG: hypothetical protein QOG97_3469 [Acidimicrobiaceae bacterium]|nr:hypothetical protein [Acidimicrobiaceae bacterium]